MCLFVCLSVCMLDDHGLTEAPSDVIFWIYTHMKPRSIIGYIILTFGFVKGQ